MRVERRLGPKDKPVSTIQASTLGLVVAAAAVAIVGGAAGGWLAISLLQPQADTRLAAPAAAPGSIADPAGDSQGSGGVRGGARDVAAPPAAAPVGRLSDSSTGGMPPLASQSELVAAFKAERIAGEPFPVRAVSSAYQLTDRKFYMVDNSKSGSDPILEYLVAHEEHVMEAFAFSLDSEWCKSKMNSGLEDFVFCTSPRADNRAWMADVGANSGFYGTMSGTLGYPVVFVEPQPHCVQYIRKEAIASGIADRVQVLNAFAGDRAVGAFDTVQRRTGCWGTFPFLTQAQLNGLASIYAGKPEYQAAVPVPMVTLDDMVLGPAGGPQRDVVIAAMKVDVEGSEGAMLEGAKRLLAEGRIYNLVMELNHNAWTLGKIDPFKVVLPNLVKLGRVGFRCRLSNYGGWHLQPNFDMSESRLSELLKEGWVGMDMWCSLAKEKRHVPAS